MTTMEVDIIQDDDEDADNEFLEGALDEIRKAVEEEFRIKPPPIPQVVAQPPTVNGTKHQSLARKVTTNSLWHYSKVLKPNREDRYPDVQFLGLRDNDARWQALSSDDNYEGAFITFPRLECGRRMIYMWIDREQDDLRVWARLHVESDQWERQEEDLHLTWTAHITCHLWFKLTSRSKSKYFYSTARSNVILPVLSQCGQLVFTMRNVNWNRLRTLEPWSKVIITPIRSPPGAQWMWQGLGPPLMGHVERGSRVMEGISVRVTPPMYVLPEVNCQVTVDPVKPEMIAGRNWNRAWQCSCAGQYAIQLCLPPMCLSCGPKSPEEEHLCNSNCLVMVAALQRWEDELQLCAGLHPNTRGTDEMQLSLRVQIILHTPHSGALSTSSYSAHLSSHFLETAFLEVALHREEMKVVATFSPSDWTWNEMANSSLRVGLAVKWE